MSKAIVLTLVLLAMCGLRAAPRAAAQSSGHRRSIASSGKKPAPQKAVAKPAPATDRKVALLGEVAKPGLVDFKPGMTVKQAIELTGGFTDAADTASVTLRRLGQSTLGTLDGKKAMAGDQVQNAPLRAGDTLYVPRLAEPPKAADARDGKDTKGASAASEGQAAGKDAAGAKTDGAAAAPAANTGLVATTGETVAPGASAALKPAVETVAAAPPATPAAPVDPGRLKFVGAVGSPGNYVYEAMALKPALEGAGGLMKEADSRKIVVKRGVREDGKAAYEIKYDYEQVVKGRVSDLELLPGDVIEVPSHKKGGFFNQVGNGLKRLLPPASVQRQIGGIMGRLLTVAAATHGVPVGLVGGGLSAGSRAAATPGAGSSAAPTALEAALVQAIFAEPPDVRERIISRVKAQLER